jgi:four helix bundle protein
MDLHSRYLSWAERPPDDLVGDPIWKLPAFRLGRFLSLIADEDAKTVQGDPMRQGTVVQLLRSVHSISANIAEGYSRFSGKDRARYFELALGSAREAREWYHRLHDSIGPTGVAQRADMLSRIIRILSVAIPQERAGASERRMSKYRRS